MENLNNADTSQADSSKTLVSADKELINKIIGKDVIDSNHPDYTLTNLDAHITIKAFGDELRISSSLEASKIFKTNKTNFEYLFAQILQLHSIQNASHLFQSKNLTSFNKAKTHWSESHHLFLKLNSFLKSSRNIKEFSQRFFKLEELELFKTIHLFIHQKGSVSSKHIQIQKESIDETTQNIKEFTTLFQAIKKSKNRSFGQSTLKAANFQILGTCIGHEFSLLNHNLILLISKDDFLPQQQEDIDFFNNYKECFKSYFEILLNVEFNFNKSLSIFDSFKNLPTGIDVGSHNLEEIYEGSFYRELSQINFNNILKQLRDTNFNLADVNHQERIILLGELLNTLKHELSNPLFGLQLSSELLLGEELDEDQKEFMQHIHNNIIRSQSIIENFSGLYKEVPETELTNIKLLLEEVFTLTKSESKQIPKQIHFEDNALLEFNTNQTYLAQIFFNLIINSSQALKEAKVTNPKIDIYISSSADKIIFIIEDNGPGIPADKKATIFEAFYTTKSSGTGLGLAISKRLAEKIGGNLSIGKSTSGASFRLEVTI